MQAIDTEIWKKVQHGSNVTTDAEQKSQIKHSGLKVNSLPAEEVGKYYLIEHQRSTEDTCNFPALRERIITDLHLVKNGVASTGSARQIFPEKFMFGEEFEYWAPKITDRNPWWVVNDLLISWEKELRDRVRMLGIPDSELLIVRTKWSKHHPYVAMRGLCDAIKVKIGSWHCKGFIDFWEGQGLLEFNTSPYRLDQTFQINAKTYTPYELFDLFIFSICNKMSLESSSGHKHVDFSESVGGNTEFLFRLLVDVEDKAWLCSAFNMELQSSTSTKFVAQSQDADKREQELKNVISLFNSLLAEGYIHEKEEFYTSLHKLKLFWNFVTGSEGRFVPVYLPRPEHGKDNAQAKSGQIVNRPTNVTAEFRFFNTPRNGSEVRLLNIFLSEWLKQINKKQLDKSNVKYTSYNPEKPQEKEKTAKMMECFCNQELGLPSSHYKQILRI